MDIEPIKESDIQKRILEGDREALACLVQQLATACSGIARQCGLDPQDVCQEGFIAAIKAIRKFDPSRETTLEAFVWGILRTKILELSRRQGRRQFRERSLDLESKGFDRWLVEIDPGQDELENLEMVDIIIASCCKDNIDRLILQLKKEDKESKAIAAELGISPALVDTRWHRIRGRARAAKVMEKFM